MHLPLSRAVSPDLHWRESCTSTNAVLVADAAQAPDFAVVATDTQTAGRGRLDREWSTPPGSALAVSVFVRHHEGGLSSRLGWLPLLAGVAMTRAVRESGVAAAGLKWPNDVLVDGRKLSGILAQLTADGVVIGAGLNLTMSRDERPVPTATSLLLEGVAASDGLLDTVLAAYLRHLRELVTQWRAAPAALTLRGFVEPELQTLGRAVRVDRPGVPALIGLAERLDDDGRLRLRVPVAGRSAEYVAVAAGDVTHLRYE